MCSINIVSLDNKCGHVTILATEYIWDTLLSTLRKKDIITNNIFRKNLNQKGRKGSSFYESFQTIPALFKG